MEAKEREKPLVKDLNEHIVCPLCRGYLIDATTLVECLHSFCRGCIVRRLSSGARACPVCNAATSPPLLPDTRLQRLVYLMVPGLFRSELERRRHFRLVNPQCPPLAPPLGGLDLTLDDFVSLSLQELDESADDSICKNNTMEKQLGPDDRKNEVASERDSGSARYLKCPAAVTVRHLVRLLMLKRGWEEATTSVNGVNRIEIMYQENNSQHGNKESMHPLNPSWTLLDLACIFGWKRETPMKLFYRVLRKEEAALISKISSYKDDATKDSPPTIENIQRPPTPPPSPKLNREPEAKIRRTPENNAEQPPRGLEPSIDRDKETKTKKPRCEVTPVMRTPEPPSGSLTHNQQSQESTKSKDLTRLEHRKRRKRRNKRVIAEITTTPREDLLKLKLRLTPCPPRITSGGGGSSGSSTGGQTKEKLLQMRALRREKLKAIGQKQKLQKQQQQQQRLISGSVIHEEMDTKDNTIDVEETIEDIIDSIPDEVVRIAQSDDANTERTIDKEVPESIPKTAESNSEPPERPKKDEEILRRLGLVAISEAGGDSNLRDKAKQRAQSSVDRADGLDREKLEKQLRESKANRVRSLLAEKQMRDALKSIMSKTKECAIINTPTTTPTSTPGSLAKKKGPPPLAPLRVAKPSGFATTSSVLVSNTSKYETPLDLSSGGPANDNVLDLSATLTTGGLSASSSSSSSSSSSPSSSSSSSYSISSLSSSRSLRPAIGAGSFFRKTKEQEQRKGQESNLKTLSDAAVSLLSSCLTDKNSVEPLALATTNIAAASKVALRIPQPHQRISGFGMKIKPNLGVRHIPNPQAVVASQYRNQKASYFSNVSQHPP